ncbi:MAG: SOS response-associated peptidase [Myxococcales bacterium]|nr:SOS response-associated peptidase [Myxococcales bacterium]
MCGRVVADLDAEGIAEVLSIDPASVPPMRLRWNVAPGTEVIFTRADDAGARAPELALWGFDEPGSSRKPINARAESVATLPLFRSAFVERRGVVVATGFYEWGHGEDAGEPFLFRRADDRPLLLAAIATPARGGAPATFCLLTTVASADVTPTHHRMPVVLERDDVEPWLRRGDASTAAGLLRTLPDGRLTRRRVSRRVNDARVDGPDLVRPVERAQLSLF